MESEDVAEAVLEDKNVAESKGEKPHGPSTGRHYCRKCRKRMKAHDAHWECEACRTCAEDCNLCYLNVTDAWRVKANDWVNKKLMTEALNKDKNTVGAAVKTSAKTSSKREKEGSSSNNVKRVETTKKTTEDKKTSGKQASPKQDEFDFLCIGFIEYLHNELDTSLPSYFLDAEFVLPDVPTHLKERFDVLRCEILRYMATFSIFCHLSNGTPLFPDEKLLGEIAAPTSGLTTLMAPILIAKIRDIGHVIYEIRETVLKDAACADPEVVQMLINGPIHYDNFFGNFTKVKARMVANPQNALTKVNRETEVKKEPVEIEFLS